MFVAPFNLSRQRRVELRQAFDDLDTKKIGYLSLERFVFLLKSIGVNISKRDLLAVTAENQERGDFSFEDLLLVAQVVYNDVAIERGLLKALRQICPKGAKAIPTATLREYLLKLGMGVKLSEEEVDMFLRIECDPEMKGFVDFETFIYRLVAAHVQRGRRGKAGWSCATRRRGVASWSVRGHWYRSSYGSST
ncbi:putative troponin c, isotype gamma [Besnoitia besnoiti]|uniref:Calmodulin n=1 Tax=Besnoitia besnoiti TaxID=94643 RepID=A0A2A9M0H3_BESBE|nr:putative troponin c, isotype gamma [Besnoitia besnoiti]PFH31475.1 putative troponin c, isotype gamma [Besnoitia besnoiti]